MSAHGRHLAGVAVWEDAQGFAHMRTFASSTAFDAALAEAEARDACADPS